MLGGVCPISQRRSLTHKTHVQKWLVAGTPVSLFLAKIEKNKTTPNPHLAKSHRWELHSKYTDPLFSWVLSLSPKECLVLVLVLQLCPCWVTSRWQAEPVTPDTGGLALQNPHEVACSTRHEAQLELTF